MISLKRIIKYVKAIADFGVWYSKDTNDVLAKYSDANQAGNADDRKSTSGVAFMWVIILSLGRVRSRMPSLYPLLRLNTSLLTAIAPNFYGCKNSFLIMVFVKNILPFIVTIPVPLTSLKILFNILKQNIQRYDTTSVRNLSKMAHSLLSSSTLMIKRPTCSLSLLIAKILNSYAKTLV